MVEEGREREVIVTVNILFITLLLHQIGAKLRADVFPLKESYEETTCVLSVLVRQISGPHSRGVLI